MKKFVIASLILAYAAFASSANAQLARVGPVDAVNHFPGYVSDLNGIALQLCLDGDGVTGPCSFDSIVPGNTWSAITGFGNQAYYSSARARIVMPNGRRGELELSTQASYLGGTPADGQQAVVGRIRYRIDVPGPGTYRIYHPYLTYPECTPDVVRIPVGTTRPVDVTRDIGGGAPFFGVLFNTPIVPVIKWDPATPPAAPAGYIGNPRVTHTVVGSPCNINVFRIEGPNIAGAGLTTVSTADFSV